MRSRLGGGLCQYKARLNGASRGVSDGTRTHDRLDHNQELYQLSYAHHGSDGLYQTGA